MDSKVAFDIIARYLLGETIDSLARRHGMPWQEVADKVGHAWKRPAHINEDGMIIAEEDLQPAGKVVGVD